MEQTVVRDPMSLDEFFALDIELIELVDGQPVLLSAATGPHQVAVTELLLRLTVAVPATHRVGLTEPPLLVVDVLSPSSGERDLVAKRRDYARAGCPRD